MSAGELILYTTEDGTVWLSQLEMAELFLSSKQNIGQHIKHVLAEGELTENSVVKQYFTTAMCSNRRPPLRWPVCFQREIQPPPRAAKAAYMVSHAETIPHHRLRDCRVRVNYGFRT
jgi:hypothetical protein